MPITRLPTPEELQKIADAGGNPQQYANKPLVFLTTEEQAAQQNPSVGTLGTIGRTAAAHAGGYVGGGVGFFGGMAAGAPLAASVGAAFPPAAVVTVPAIEIGAGIIGASGGGYVGQKAQQAIEPEALYAAQQQAAEEAAAANPKTALATDIIASAIASGGRPSMDALRAGKAVAGRLIGRGAEDAVERLAQNKAIAGTLMGAGLNPAINTGIGLATGQGLPSGTDLAAQVAGGALFSRQAKWAAKLTGHAEEPAPEVTNGNETTTADVKTPERGEAETPYSAVDEQGRYQINDKRIKQMFLSNLKKVSDITDPIEKAKAQTINDQLRDLHPDDMREQLHQAELSKSVLPDKMEDTDYQGGEIGAGSRWQEPSPEVNNSSRPAKTSDILTESKLTTPKASNESTGLPTSQASPAPVSANAQDFLKAKVEELAQNGIGSKVTAPPVLPKVNPVVEEAKAREREQRNDNTQPKTQAELVAEQFEQKGNVNAPPSDSTRPKYIGLQKGRGNIPDTDYYNLVRPITGKFGEIIHAAGSTVSEHTLRKYGVDFDPKGVPTVGVGGGKIGIPIALQSHIKSGAATTGSILQHLADLPNHPYAPLAKALLNMSDTKSLGVKWNHDDRLDTNQLLNEKGEIVRSHYDPTDDQVNIGTHSAADARVVLEEAVHGMTVHKFPNFKGQGALHLAELEEYLKNGKNEHAKGVIKAYIDTAKALGIHDELFGKDGVAGNPDEALNRLQGVGHATAYAMGNIDEFIAQAIKDHEFQERLANIRIDGGKSILTRLKEALGRLIGLGKDNLSMLDTVFKHSEGVINSNRDGSEGTRSASLPRQKQTDTPEFKKWFGNSVLKDEKGEPIRLYHGTNADIDSFKQSKEGTLGKGIYLTPNENTASAYAANNQFAEKVKGGMVYPVYAKLEKPLILTGGFHQSNIEALEKLGMPREKAADLVDKAMEDNGNLTGEIQAKAKAQGYDGIVSYGNGILHEVVAFHPEQIKSAIGNRGTFDPNEKSIVKSLPKPPEGQSHTPEELNLPKDKYMGKIGAAFRSVIDKVCDIPQKAAGLLADSATKALNRETELKGRWKNAIVQAGEGLSKIQKDRVMMAFNHELATKTSGLPLLRSAAERNFYNKARQLIDDSGKYRLSIGEPITEAKSVNGRTIYVKRNLKQDEFYFPGMANQKVQQTYRNNTDHAAIDKLDAIFHDYNTKTLGLSESASQERIDNYKKSLQGSIKNSDISHQDYFNAHRKAQGTPLPPSFRETDPVRNLERYFDRAAIDASHYEFMEKDHNVLAALGQDKDAWNNKVVGDKGISSLANNPAVKGLLEHWKGEPVSPAEGNEQSLSSLVSSAFISGPALELHKTVSNIVKTLSLSSNPIVLAKAVTHAVGNVMHGYNTAVENGVVKLTARSAMQMVDGNATAAERLQAASRIIRKVSTLNDLTTKVSTGLVQSMNEVIIPSKIARGAAGDITAQKFLKNLDPSYNPNKLYSPEEIKQLASRSANYIHGTGDIRSMPAWMLNDSEFSGFFSLAHWSIAQTNNFMKDIYEPATRGDIAPLITGIFGAAIGGYIIKELRQDIQGKKSTIPSLAEISASDKGLEGNKGLVAYNMIAAMQFAGFGGLLSQLAKYPFDAAYKNNPQGATFPMDEVASDLASTLHQVSTAIANDPNVNWVDLAKAVTMHTLSSNFQLSRIAINQGINHGLITGLPAEKKMLSDKMGQLRRFDMVEGLPYNEIDEASNPYMNLGQKKFKMEQDLPTAMQQLPSLVQNIMDTYHDKPDVMMSKLKSLKQNEYATFPSMENMPLSFMKYIGYLSRMEGADAAQEELMDYMKHKTINEVKSSAVP